MFVRKVGRKSECNQNKTDLFTSKLPLSVDKSLEVFIFHTFRSWNFNNLQAPKKFYN